jgi:hypothetical protein
VWRQLNQLDRRWVFLAMLLAVTGPLVFGFSSPAALQNNAKAVFDKLEDLPEGSRIALAIDYDPASEAELHPMAIAFVRHCILKKHKMYFVTLWPSALPIIDRVVRQVIEGEFKDRRLVYGEDYVHLGYHPGEIVAIKVLCTDIRGSKTRDDRGLSLDSLPMTRDLRGLKELDLLLNVSGGFPGAKEWIQISGEVFEMPVAAGSVGVQVPQLLPYQPDPLIGLVGALRGAVEYETAVAAKYSDVFQPASPEAAPLKNIGQRRMGPQLWAHLLIVGLIILGNALYLNSRFSKGAA